MDVLEQMRLKANGPAVKHRKRPSHEEDDIQMACVKWFGLQYPKLALLLHHSPNEGKLHGAAREGKRRKDMGLRAGFPDLIFLMPNKRYPYVGIEMKTSKGTQEKSQKEYQNAIEKAGGLYRIARSLEEFQTIIRDYLNE